MQLPDAGDNGLSALFQELILPYGAVDMEHLRNQAGPAGLVAGADANTGVAVKIFIEKNEILPMGIALKFLRIPMNGPPTVAVRQEKPRQASGDFFADFVKRHHPA